ncbi:N-acetylglucosamine kinase [Arachidicoccus soli]|uniref:N-acetylglucosamine kinase n=1 Tax=Arachidicoccus soli TaxID=2341117 RepID=A0A386HMG0_9BACT|nr:N-acetylglucosamine kinase [Arachidicoccus soli]AYD46975.1 N-acetylglucosamine kinase [Arachidicoccus soli]
MATKLIADSGATKCSWYLMEKKKNTKVATTGLNPYFLKPESILDVLSQYLLPALNNKKVDEIYFYGAGLSTIENKKIMRKILSKTFPDATIEINSDLIAAARATCGHSKGVVSILGTGSGCAYFNGKKIIQEQNGIGYVLGDEGSGAYLGRKVLQYYLYKTFDEDLMNAFEKKYNTSRAEILNNTYQKPFPSQYLAGFSIFLSENRGHYMVENIIEDGLNDFIVTHLYKFREAWTMPLHFIGGIAFAFKDVLKELCNTYELELGNIQKQPIEALASYHQ